jgi:arylsulfatase A-like enzyme
MANRVPLAIRWGRNIASPGRSIDDFVSFIDVAPTILDLAGLTREQTGMAEFTGRSLTTIFQSEKSGRVVPERDHVLLGRERTDVGRPHDWGYPVRAVVRSDVMLIENFEPSRWPGGNPETGYMDCDAGATKTFLIEAHRKNPSDPWWAFCFGLRPAVEFYDLTSDPDFVKNLPDDPRAAPLRQAMHAELRLQADPRMEGKGDIFDRYEHAAKAHVGFYEKFMRGENVRAGWIDPGDIEPKPAP